MSAPRLSGTHHHTKDNILGLEEIVHEAIDQAVGASSYRAEEAEQGPRGVPGPKGDAGAAGATGATGATGPAGTPADVEDFDGSPLVSTPTMFKVPSGSLSQPSAGVAVIDMRPVVSLFDATGLTDGAAVDFPLPDFCVPDSVLVWEDGLMLRPVVDYVEDADMSGVTLAAAPPAATALLIRYEADQA